MNASKKGRSPGADQARGLQQAQDNDRDNVNSQTNGGGEQAPRYTAEEVARLGAVVRDFVERLATGRRERDEIRSDPEQVAALNDPAHPEHAEAVAFEQRCVRMDEKARAFVESLRPMAARSTLVVAAHLAGMLRAGIGLYGHEPFRVGWFPPRGAAVAEGDRFWIGVRFLLLLPPQQVTADALRRLNGDDLPDAHEEAGWAANRKALRAARWAVPAETVERMTDAQRERALPGAEALLDAFGGVTERFQQGAAVAARRRGEAVAFPLPWSAAQRLHAALTWIGSDCMPEVQPWGEPDWAALALPDTDETRQAAERAEKAAELRADLAARRDADESAARAVPEYRDAWRRMDLAQEAAEAAAQPVADAWHRMQVIEARKRDRGDPDALADAAIAAALWERRLAAAAAGDVQ